MIRARAGSPGSAWAIFCACSKRMWGGSGGTSGSVIASITTGPPAASASSHAGPDRVRGIDADALESHQLGVAGVGKVRQVLGYLKLGIAGHHPLLPGHLVEIVVVQYEHHQLLVLPAVAVVREIDQREDPQHLHRAVADGSDHRTVGIGELRRQRIRH